MKKIVTIILSIFLLGLATKPVAAIEDPFLAPNNRFGIHIIDENDLEDAKALVNSSGGDWGYITMVIQQNDKNVEKWQRIFDKMGNLHLIPLVRLATEPLGNIWIKPLNGESVSWADFLNNLKWPTKNRYVIVGNEPNHAKEWGGKINPKEYSEFYKETAVGLKLSSDDFFVMPAGLDASAPNTLGYMSEEKFLKEFISSDPEVVEYIDGLSSHSYPNPGFSGSELATGRGTIKTFEWELEYLKSLGVTKKIPVFITETGWINTAGNVGNKLIFAYQNVWNNENIAAVTPFLLNYESRPFDKFSWKDKNGNYYPQYKQIANLPKVKGEPMLNDSPKKEDKKIKKLPKLEVASILFGIYSPQPHGQLASLMIK